MARPSTVYTDKTAEQCRKLALLGLTDKEICEIIGTCEANFYKLKNAHPELVEALKKGKDIADAEVVHSLYKRACGFKEKINKVVLTKDGPINYEEEVYFAPDTTAAIFWLKNRQAANWRDKKEIDQRNTHELPSHKEFIDKLLGE